ncbi:Uncharacterised protein [uncultured archaeon]|nr:Uncharacterised protein [uncultured archaeon]
MERVKNIDFEKWSCKPGQPSSPITPILALLLMAGFLNSRKLTAEAIRFAHWSLVFGLRDNLIPSKREAAPQGRVTR